MVVTPLSHVDGNSGLVCNAFGASIDHFNALRRVALTRRYQHHGVSILFAGNLVWFTLAFPHAAGRVSGNCAGFPIEAKEPHVRHRSLPSVRPDPVMSERR